MCWSLEQSELFLFEFADDSFSASSLLERYDDICENSY